MLATQDVSQRCKELGIQALHINMQVTGSNMTKTMPNLNNQTVIGDCKCAMKIVDEESENGDVIQVDVDIHKEKRKKYNNEYYARCKEKKMKRITNGEDSSTSPCAAASQPKLRSIQVKVYTAKEKQRIIINEKYHAQSKKKLKIRRIAYGEGNGQSKTLVTNISAMETTQKNIDKGTTPVRAVNVGGRRNTHNKTYHQQRNEQNRMITLRKDSSFKPPARKRVLEITPNEKTIVSTEVPFQNSLLLERTADMPNLLGVEGSANHNRVASLSLQAELEKLSKVKNIADKFHEAIKLKLKSEYEKEVEEMIGEMNRKYEAKCQKVEAAFQMKTNEIDIHLDKVVMNKILSEALRSKCQDLDVSFLEDIYFLLFGIPLQKPGIHCEFFRHGS